MPLWPQGVFDRRQLSRVVPLTTASLSFFKLMSLLQRRQTEACRAEVGDETTRCAHPLPVLQHEYLTASRMVHNITSVYSNPEVCPSSIERISLHLKAADIYPARSVIALTYVELACAQFRELTCSQYVEGVGNQFTFPQVRTPHIFTHDGAKSD